MTSATLLGEPAASPQNAGSLRSPQFRAKFTRQRGGLFSGYLAALPGSLHSCTSYGTCTERSFSKSLRDSPLDLPRIRHVKIEAWMLEQTAVEQPKEEPAGLRLVITA